MTYAVSWSFLPSFAMAMGLLFASNAWCQQPVPVEKPDDEASVVQRPDVAGNEQVADIIRTFEGRGVQSDGSSPTPPDQATDLFRVKNGLSMELIASEPEISQPLFLSWDSRGRMWVVQYRQYQYPAGLKVIRYDQHLRAVFDKVPLPPPMGVRGEDRISVMEDTDQDGKYDTVKDVITGLNIATSVQVGHGGIWVLNPPYLLFYPDADRDDVPDSDPEVRLSGFGLQDTHSVANSLLWGPDGWLYGVNGSTTTCNISSDVTKDVAFQGQCVWRYHPDSRVFEIYAEGGGNSFSLEMDSGGRVFVGHNGGNTRGWYFPQGSYGRKNWGKHGPLTNPYAFGFFESMKMKGDTRRFPQAFCIYEGGLFDPSFRGDVIAPNSLHNVVWHDELLADGSTFRTEPKENLVETSDRWFRPVYSGVGPDGCVYMADWYDTRLSHVSPIDDWHKESGRIYRLRPADQSPSLIPDDLHLAKSTRLVALLRDPNKWVRQRAALELGWRKEKSVTPRLVSMVDEGSLDALWAIHLLGEFTTSRAQQWMQHEDADIRRWVVRLLGDRQEDHDGLVELAKRETQVAVRSQLASTAKRLSTPMGIRIIRELIRHDEDASDPHLPLLIWWALESHANDWESVRTLLQEQQVWNQRLFVDHLASRLMQRYATEGGQENFLRCAGLLDLAPGPSAINRLMDGLHRAFEGLAVPDLPPSLAAAIREHHSSQGQDGLVFRLRQQESGAAAEAVQVLRDQGESLRRRQQITKTLGEVPTPEALSTLLDFASGKRNDEPSIQRLALQSLQRYEDASIAETLVSRFDSSISAEHGVRDAACRTLASRPAWAKRLLEEIRDWKVRTEDVPEDVQQQLRSHSDPDIQTLVNEVFGQAARTSSEETKAEIERLRRVIEAGTGNWNSGKELYTQHCAKCHQLFGEGLRVGPPLDGYERGKLDFWLLAIVDPNLEIREGFQSYVAMTDDGRVINGMVAQQNDRTVTLRDADNRTTVVRRDELEEFKALPTSLMPVNTLANFSDEQLRNLFAYLMKDPPKNTPITP